MKAIRLAAIILCTVLSVIALLHPTSAQTTFGTILGTVTDPSGAVLPNVTITVINQGENTSREVVSDAQGNYQAENLKAGRYTIKARVTGFREVTTINIVVAARQIVRADVKLVMGTASEEVTVVANPELINTESQTISSGFDSNEVLELPANYRGAGSTSPYSLLAYLPGVTGDGDGNITVQGAGTNQVEYSMDGISTVDIRFSGPQREMFVSAEGISEMKVQGSGGGAEYGNPADITTTSKSGTNVFHGSAFEYFQNKVLDATRMTVPQVVKPAKSANDFGGSFSGPLFGKRTFFFADYEGMRYRTQTVSQQNVPSQAFRNGDFSGQLGSQQTNCGTLGDQPCVDPLLRPVLPGEVFDPATSRVVIDQRPSGQNACDPTAPPPCFTQVSNGFGFDPVTNAPIPGQANMIPAGQFDPRATAILNFYPLPNSSGDFNYVVNVPNPILSDQLDIRVDHTINTKQSIFGRWSYKNIRKVNPAGLLLPAQTNFEHDNQIVLAHNYTITPTLINELRGGISRRQGGGDFPFDGPGFMQTLGLNSQQLGPFPAGGFPDFVFEPRSSIDAIVHTRPNTELSRNFQINENLTWIKGKHTMKFGFDVRKLHLITTWYSGSSAADDYGDFFFNGQYTGNNFADFLLGIPYYTYVTHTPPRNIDGNTTHYYGYASDTFKATQKLTLTAGLRISRIPPLYDPINLTNFDPSVPITGQVIISSDPRSLAATQPLWAEAVNACNTPNDVNPKPGPAPCTPFLTSKQAGWPKALRNVYTNFTPRLGFAYRPFSDNKTVIRGGVGVYDVTTLGAVFFSVAGIHDGFQGNFANTLVCDPNSPPGTCVPNPNFFKFPDVLDPNPTNTGFGTQSFFTANQRDKKDPYSVEWNLSVERVIHGNTSLRVSYIASRANQLTWSPNLNQPRPGDSAPFPAWSHVRCRCAGAISTYESMQTELIHKYSHGLTLQSTWTWARNLSDTESWPRSGFDGEITGDAMNQYNLRGDYGNVGGTRKHRWITTLVDEIPVGKGRQFLTNANGVVDGILGGWQLSTIFLAQTGPFDTPFMQFNSSGNANFGFNRPDLAGNPNDVHHTSTQWWDPNLFACPGGTAGQDYFPGTVLIDTDNKCSVIGRFGNASVGSLVGPPTVTWNLGMSKRFHMTERVALKFESSFTNVLNHPNYDDPRNNLTEGGASGLGTFGKVLATRIGDAGGNRVGQLALRIEF